MKTAGPTSISAARSVAGGFVVLFGAGVIAACSTTSKVAPPAARPASLPASCAAAGVADGVAGGVAGGPSLAQWRAMEPVQNPAATFDSAWSIIERTHWDTTYNGVDWAAVREELRPVAIKAQTRGELRTILGSMVGRLKQSHFAIIPEESASPQSRDASDIPSRAGGGWLGFTFRYVGQEVLVTHVEKESPAWQAGVRPGWSLEAIRGCPVRAVLSALIQSAPPPAPNVSSSLAFSSPDADQRQSSLTAYQTVSHLLNQAPGEPLALTFNTGSGKTQEMSQEISIVPASPPGLVAKLGNLPSMAVRLTWERIQDSGRTIGVIRFNFWMPVISSQFDAAIDSLRQADAIVLDLRGNLGGVTGMTSGLAGHFVDSAVVLGTAERRKFTQLFTINPRRVNSQAQAVTPYSGPLAILVDELSASTTEVFAAGLQALKRATVFGTQSAGQALPAVVERLPNDDILMHPIGDFRGPTGVALEGAGVTPDVVTPLSRESLINGHDPALEAALSWAQRELSRPRPEALPRPRP